MSLDSGCLGALGAAGPEVGEDTEEPGALPTVPVMDTRTYGLCNRDPRRTQTPY